MKVTHFYTLNQSVTTRLNLILDVVDLLIRSKHLLLGVKWFHIFLKRMFLILCYASTQPLIGWCNGLIRKWIIEDDGATHQAFSQSPEVLVYMHGLSHFRLSHLLTSHSSILAIFHYPQQSISQLVHYTLPLSSQVIVL